MYYGSWYDATVGIFVSLEEPSPVPAPSPTVPPVPTPGPPKQDYNCHTCTNHGGYPGPNPKPEGPPIPGPNPGGETVRCCVMLKGHCIHSFTKDAGDCGGSHCWRDHGVGNREESDNICDTIRKKYERYKGATIDCGDGNDCNGC